VTAPHFDVAVIGGGASGALVAVHFRRLASHGKLALIEAGARAARGLAYGTPYGAHLLNVPAGRMSAIPDEPEHFLRWLCERVPDAQASTFAPRALYGDYLADQLREAAIDRIGGTAVGLTLSGAGSHAAEGGGAPLRPWLVHLQDGRIVSATSVVLALGNLPPWDPMPLDRDVPEYLRDPWAPAAAAGLSPDAPVLFIGTGLTMIDVALALRAEGHRGTLFALSRHGRLPASHAPFDPKPVASVPFSTPREALRWVREQAATRDWRAVIDALRPHTASTWRGWSVRQRASFLRHARNLWDVHRHRTAPSVAAHVDDLRAQNVLRILKGHIVSLASRGGEADVVWRPRGSETTETLRVARVLNCTGPAGDYARVDLPLVVHMRRAGWLTPDPLGLGVETDADGRLLDREGNPVAGLFTLGPLRRPSLWESTAIPEIREQAVALSRVLTAVS
jgi:uncharacterized NAD(P)/FAD-binding protein YdhS